jgi:hypothetical protein
MAFTSPREGASIGTLATFGNPDRLRLSSLLGLFRSNGNHDKMWWLQASEGIAKID